MSAFSFLDQLLKAGSQAAGQYNARQSDAGRYATGAGAGSLLTMLLGSNSGRRMGGKAVKIGGAAALGALAWKAYSNYQAQQAQQAQSGQATQPGAVVGGGIPVQPAMYAPPPALPAPDAESHSRALLKAMIAAAKSDGHMDERERGLVEAELQRQSAPAELRTWVETELRRPVEPADVAAGAQGPEQAAEIYLASLLVVDETTTMERAYLDELARQLRLDVGLKAQLEAQAAAA